MKRFLYLDEAAVTEYLSAMEGGIRGTRSTRKTVSGEGGGGIDLKVVKGEAKRSTEREEEIVFEDSPHARFERLETLCMEDEERSGWLSVIDPDTDLSEAATGAMLDLECDVYVPDFLQAISNADEFAAIGKAMETIAPFADLFDIKDMPDARMIDAAQKFGTLSELIGKRSLVVGEIEASDWKIAGQLHTEYIRGDLEGLARVVGKLKTKWSSAIWKPLMALPGTQLIPREQRRKMERTGPGEGKEDQFLQGPAAMVDILAIYR